MTLKPTDSTAKRASGAPMPFHVHKCYRCGFEWQPPSAREDSAVCPKCKTALKLHLSGHDSTGSRHAAEQESVREHKPGAFVMIRGHKCYRCSHEWQPIDMVVAPKVCPKCKTPYWDRPPRATKHSAHA